VFSLSHAFEAGVTARGGECGAKVSTLNGFSGDPWATGGEAWLLLPLLLFENVVIYFFYDCDLSELLRLRRMFAIAKLFCR
jgi:hypothetical protein